MWQTLAHPNPKTIPCWSPQFGAKPESYSMGFAWFLMLLVVRNCPILFMAIPHRWRIYRRIYIYICVCVQKFSQHALCQWIVLSFDESSLPITFFGVYVSWREGMSPSILLASLSGSPHSLLCKGMPPRRWNSNIQPTFGYIWCLAGSF